MTSPKTSLARLTLGLVLAGWALAAGAATQPIGGELRGNSDYDHLQKKPLAVYHPQGGFTVIWENEQLGISARRFNAAGQPQGADFLLVANVRLNGNGVGPVVYNYTPAAVGLPNGGYWLAWAQERAILHLDPFNEWREVQHRDIFMQRFNAQGHPNGEPIAVSLDPNALHSRPAMALHRRHGLMVAWESNDGLAGVTAADGIHARRFSLQGASISPPERVNALDGAEAARPDVAVNNEGRFLVAWEGCCTDGDRSGIFARIYGRNGQPIAPYVIVNTSRNGIHRRPAVAADPSNNFFVVWQGRYDAPLTSRIWGQVVNRSGGLIGGQSQVSSGDWGGTAQTAPSLVNIPSGGYYVIWIDYLDNFPLGIFGVEVDRFSAPVGSEAKLSATQIGSQFQTSLATDRVHEVLALWEGYHGNERGITAVRLSTSPDRGTWHGLTVGE